MQTIFYSLLALGLNTELVKIEVDNYKSNPGTVIVGLGDAAVQESKERVRSAIKNSGFRYPRGRVVVNLAPADTKKSGPIYDLAIAIGLICLANSIRTIDLRDTVIIGELALDGSIRPVTGVLALLSEAKSKGFSKVILPTKNKEEASLVSDLEVYAFDKLIDAYEFACGNSNTECEINTNVDHIFKQKTNCSTDLSDIKGQFKAKRAIEIAAAGSHNILMSGPPGTGKTMLAKALQGILPRMTVEEALEVTKIYSIAGLLSENEFIIKTRPYRFVHHTASGVSIVGGGRIPMPGEISLAHRGVLFLDEIAEFPKNILELLRQPLEDRKITISRTEGKLTYPAQFVLCAAMNPCPCGYKDSKNIDLCHCQPAAIDRYQKKLSGPFLDRIDIFCQLETIAYKDLEENDKNISIEDSSQVSERVQKARDLQTKRFAGQDIISNSEMSIKDIRKHCHLNDAVKVLFEKAMTNMNITARSYHRLIKLSRTIADLNLEKDITENDVLEALSFRFSMLR